MSREHKPTASEILKEGWRLTQESMASEGMPVSDTIKFQIDRKDQIRATRVARLDELAKAIGALNATIDRLSKRLPTDVLPFEGGDIDELRRDWASLMELLSGPLRTDPPALRASLRRCSPMFLSGRRVIYPTRPARRSGKGTAVNSPSQRASKDKVSGEDSSEQY
jgi:hypothetical protein